MELGIGGLGPATEIGAGASAVVYKALQVNLDRQVAVKVLSATDEAFVRRFHREAMTLGKLSLNPGIVTVHGTGVTESGHPYLILELCESSVLDHLKTEGRFDPESACLVGSQIADAVSDAHNNGVIHRDIKPGNLLRSQNGRYLITDFGIATVRGSTLGQTDSIGFTAGYVAPETLRGEEAGTPSDVYALGATLFHMLAGYPPFVDQSGNSNLLALAQRVINDPVPDLRQNGVPDDVCRIVEAAMAKHPADRPSAAQLRDQLQAASQTDRAQFVPPAVSAPVPTGAEKTILGVPHQPATSATAPLSAASLSQAELTAPADTVPAADTGLPWQNHGDLDQTTAMTGMADAAPPAQAPQAEYRPPVEDHRPSGGVLLGSDTHSAVPPGRANYPLPPHSDGGPQPWKILLLGVLAGSVILLATVAIAINRSGDNDGVDASDTTPESPATNDDASEGGADDQDTNGVSNSLPGSATSLIILAEVPDVTGQTEAAARSRLVAEDFEVLVQERTSETATAGTIIQQNPAAGAEAEVGSLVMLFVATTPEVEAVAIPTLAGLTEQQAVTALTALDLIVGDPIREFSELPDGEVIRSAPAEGTAVDPGSNVVLIISKGIAPPACSELIGSTEAEATTLIEAAGLTLEATRAENETDPEGQVTECSATETTISLTISDGPEICGVVIGQQLAAGTAALEAKGYAVTATGELRPALTVGEIFECEKQETTAAISYATTLPTECPADVIGGTAPAARTALQNLGFTDITVEPVESDVAPAGQVIDCQVSGDAVTVTVSTGPAVENGKLTVDFDSLQIVGGCAGDGLRPDLYGSISVSYGGQSEDIWDNRARNDAETPRPSGKLNINEDQDFSNVDVGQDLVVTWNLRDVDRAGQSGDEDTVDDDVSNATRTITLTGADREWKPTSDNNDACNVVFDINVKWSGLGS